MALSYAGPCLAQAPDPAPPVPSEADDDQIVVIGDRVIIASLQDVAVERVYDETDVASYAVSTVGELLDEIRRESGDDDTALLINGRPVRNVDDIADLPVEAIARIEALPRGSAQRVGGTAGQRAYNVVLRPAVRSLTGTAGRETATEGGFGTWRGEALATYIRGQDRLNLTFREQDSDPLFQIERPGFIPRTERVPYSAVGNILPAGGLQVDPALSALVGSIVTVVALPAGNANPTLADLAAGANTANSSNIGLFRTLRGGNRNNEIALSGSKQLSAWLSFSGNARMGWNRGRSFSGLPAARFLIPPSNPFTPFNVPVSLAINDPSRPLISHSRFTTASLSGTFNANLRQWVATVTGRYDRNRNDFDTAFTGAFVPGGTTVDAATNPFAGKLAASIPVTTLASVGRTTTFQINADLEGPLAQLWAGPLRGRAGAGATWLDYDTDDSGGPRRFHRHEYLAKGGLTIPLTSGGEAGFLPQLGDTEIAGDVGRVGLGIYGKLSRYSLALNSQPRSWIRVTATQSRDEIALAPELFSSPAIITPNVPYFDLVTQQTVEVTTINGGAGALKNQTIRTTAFGLTLSPMKAYNLQLNANYTISRFGNQIGALPAPSTAVVAAFPDRFVRDASGTLVTVDQRSVNFAQQRTRQLRLGASFKVPVSQAAPQAPLSKGQRGPARRRTPPLALQVNASHTFVLESTTVIRPGLPSVDLLEGGAIGISGGGQRNSSEVSMTLIRGKSGMKFNLRRRGDSYLVIGTVAAPDRLAFNDLTTADFKLYTELGDYLRDSKWAKDTRLSFGLANIFNDRQLVSNNAGVTPQAYQPILRDAVGRTASFELRKVF